ncbi:oxidoreductase [Synechococcus sp. KORDI-52]|uniref:SDR family oxidoreductase n=1 Tax=Synechococcus sp. KORDI-52 TaxID=585425 RepID=UPI0004E04B65|nr:SDR family oxidoreductase [Synechococcus sp. KORDI-52]AII47990.1 oxidoreductase [Synechococcus sp. KORDI-52]
MLIDLVKRSRPLASDAKLLVLGGGYSGRCLASLARAMGTPVLCTRRSLDATHADLLFDSNGQDRLDPGALEGVTHLLCTIPPDRDGNDPVLSKLLVTLRNLPLRWAGYLSTTGVYGDRQGSWVSEQDEPSPMLDRSIRRLNCEKAWLHSGLPIQILRLPGIYGPGRSVLNALHQGRARLIDKPGQVFCRIHVEDIAGACWHLMHRTEQGTPPTMDQGNLVNVVDDLPAPTAELMRHAASLLGCALPPLEPFDQIVDSLSPMAQTFWSENRRVSNHKLCHDLGYTLLHPDYFNGLQDCLNQDRLNPPDLHSPPRSTNG